jgi:hypothetical protein
VWPRDIYANRTSTLMMARHGLRITVRVLDGKLRHLPLAIAHVKRTIGTDLDRDLRRFSHARDT